MPVTIRELYDSREAQVAPGASSAELHYQVAGTEDEADVMALVEATAPAAYLGLVAQGYRVRHEGGGVWDVRAAYGVRPRRETGQAIVSYDTTGGTQHITQSISTAEAVKADGVAGDVPDLKGAIGVNGDQVEGTDVGIAQLNLVETRFIAAADVTGEWIRTVRDLTYTVNAGTFRGFEAGEVLFLGATMTYREGAADWECVFRFSISKNATGLSIAGSSTFDKDGWEYLWVMYEPATAETNLVRKPKYIYVERVYDVADFTLLGIGS